MGAFALLLRWLPWWQAVILAAAALAFNLLVLPRVGARLYRPGRSRARRPRHRLLSAGRAAAPARVPGAARHRRRRLGHSCGRAMGWRRWPAAPSAAADGRGTATRRSAAASRSPSAERRPACFWRGGAGPPRCRRHRCSSALPRRWPPRSSRRWWKPSRRGSTTTSRSPRRPAGHSGSRRWSRSIASRSPRDRGWIGCRRRSRSTSAVAWAGHRARTVTIDRSDRRRAHRHGRSTCPPAGRDGCCC